MKKESPSEHSPVQGSSDRALEKARKLAPPEERSTNNANKIPNNGGVMNVDTGNLNLPKDFTERDDKKSLILGLDPVAVAILIFAIAFIALITYFIAIAPPKPREEAPPARETRYRRPSLETHVGNQTFCV